MSSTDARWAGLSSQNERVIRAGEPGCGSTDQAGTAALSQWAELASQTERLAGDTDPLFRLASSGHTMTGMRLVAGAA
jgi:hypothetical protein